MIIMMLLMLMDGATAQYVGPDLVIVEHTYDGYVERHGRLVYIQYAFPTSYVEWTDIYTDGVFRNGFEVVQ